MTYKMMSPYLTHLSTLQKTIRPYYTTRIITKLTTIGVPAPTYLGLLSQFRGVPFKLHKFWFCANDINHCVGI
jgi:hypothetical protein